MRPPSERGVASFHNRTMLTRIHVSATEWNHLKTSTVEIVLLRCKIRIKEQAERLSNRLQFVYGHDRDHYLHPKTNPESPTNESSQDMDDLGQYCEETHESYMCLCEERVRQLKRSTAEVANLGTANELQGLQELSQLAYSVRKSNSFERFLQANLNRQPEPGVSMPTALKIIERLGKISKIYRAALTVADFVAKVEEVGRKIAIEVVPTSKIPIPELADRTAAHLRVRAGHRSRWGDENKLKHLLKRWPRYRQHAELQLIIFYEENPHIHLFSNHIGCNKHACYLCFNFIKLHARFQVDAGHQSLYSLWTVKDVIKFSSLERAQMFQSALKKVSVDVEQKFQQLKAAQWRHLGFTTANESPTNLSRISLSPAVPCYQSRSPVVSQTHLSPIQEALPQDVKEVKDHQEQTIIDQANAALTQTLASIHSSFSLARSQTPPLITISRAPYSSSFDTRKLPPEYPSSFHETSTSCVPPLNVGSNVVQTLSPRDLTGAPFEDRKSSGFAAANGRSLSLREVGKSAMANSQEGASTIVVRHHEHRKRHRRLHNVSKGRPTSRYTGTPSQRTSTRRINGSLHSPEKLRRQKRRRDHNARHRLHEAPPNRSSLLAGFSSIRRDKPQQKRARRHERNRRPDSKRQGCFSGLSMIFRYIWPR